ncbi:Hypothetical protein NTJ_01453 [Nesidiocoris tenuis]|uniref:MAM domain-containing protein n=1 Tax=Nesidiocoris tenuis TaxID=355587 RepID=A0ABN7A8L9_9HEMI|nr:Hypothetical protein NTJ_01453 [Nesidiocoris tenuis]
MSLRRPLVVVALLIAAASRPSAGSTSAASVAVCDFERPCDWESRDSGFKIVTGIEVNNTWIPKPGYVGGPFTDADNNTNGESTLNSI